jgi:hypothetical protein
MAASIVPQLFYTVPVPIYLEKNHVAIKKSPKDVFLFLRLLGGIFYMKNILMHPGLSRG